MRTIAIGSDHAGFSLKEHLKKNFPKIKWIDHGTRSAERTDYPDYAWKVGEDVAQGRVNEGVLVCGSGIGMCIAANKIAGVRAAVVESETTARLSREHNNANILCLGSRILTPEYAKSVLKAWLDASFEGGRHEARIQKISDMEKKR